MKKLLVTLGVLLAVAVPALAATTATITLVGSVPLTLNLSVVETGNGSGLDLSVSTNVKLATVVATTNNPAGLSVSARSTNVTTAACTTPCLYSNTTGEFLSYSLVRDTTTLTFTGDTATYASSTSRGASNTELFISFVGNPLLAAGTDYGDNIVFTVSAN